MRSLVALGAIIVALYGLIALNVKFGDASWTPNLALDLEGGTQIILTPVATDGSEVTSKDIDQAINIIRQRVDGSGVAEAEISSQGGNNIVVALPGTPSEETLDLVRRSAHMDFRPVLVYGAPTAVEPTADPTAEATADPTTEPSAEPSVQPSADAAAAPAPDATAEATAEPTAEPTAEASAEPTPTPTATEAARPSEPSSASDASYWITDEVQQQYDELDCTDPANLTGGEPGVADEAFVACDKDGTAKFILGPVEIAGTEIDSASSGLETLANGAVGNRWVVDMEFTSKGADQFADVTTRLAELSSPQNQFAMVLDGLVISAPSVSDTIPDGRAQISGTFTQASAAALANQLNYGSLPLTFEVQSEQEISATIGSEQLAMGLLAGLIGLVLVVVYSMLQYRTLGLLTVGSLSVAGILTYGLITALSHSLLPFLPGNGYRLSLAGVAGLIVAIGITADSFIVYFERVRDELRDGRDLTGSVERGWDRAKRTILASDTVNLLAAIVLYFLAVGGVRGFAYTLGLTTIIDVVVVFLFTHPVMELISRTRFFGNGHPASGLDPRRLGAPAPVRYVGRGKVVQGEREPQDALVGAAAGTSTKATRTAGKATGPVGTGSTGAAGASAATSGMTIAERRAAERAAQAAESEPYGSPPDDTVDDVQDVTDAPQDGRAEGSEH
ncbi:protein translocase subunit SecD [Cellulomonas composti]|uniref:Protein translocase subunit SecD n=1 Tax=Cellulomonas composti TaxID=266130 RepID=A0A511J6M1_9CELL|nr:protein translocase subunit SecD [Cellulomonas composti]